MVSTISITEECWWISCKNQGSVFSILNCHNNCIYGLHTTDKVDRDRNILITVISAVVIWIMAPVENGNKRLDSVEYRVYRQRTRKILLLEVLLFVLSLTFGWEDLVIVITMVFSIVCVVLVTGKVKMLKDRRRTVC